jgi:multidrug resistance efflux pump
VAEAEWQQDLARLKQAQVNLKRTRIVSQVNGYVTNLTAQVGDYATAGRRVLTVVNTDSFWVEGYFEETQIEGIHLGDPVEMSLMGHSGLLRGHVESISRGIEVANAQSGDAGLASVNPVYTWIRLAQRVPVRISIDEVPPSVTLVVGLTATVRVGDPDHPPAAPDQNAEKK